MASTWILVADRCDARILEYTAERKVRLLQHLEHPEGRLQDHDFDSDRAGNVRKVGEGAFHAMSQEQTPHERVAEKWAQQLADLLHDARTRGAFDRLILVAEPKFLGHVRTKLDAQTQALVIATVDKELTRVPERELEKYLGEAMLRGDWHARRP
jgi:protein required for attachment to host cells